MKTNEIIEICRTAKSQADDAGDNWADFVDCALNAAGVGTDESAAQELCNRGEMNVVAVLSNGRVIECHDDGSWHIGNLSDYDA